MQTRREAGNPLPNHIRGNKDLTSQQGAAGIRDLRPNSGGTWENMGGGWLAENHVD